MPQCRYRIVLHGRRMARNMPGARSLWRATGMTDGDFDKPIIAVVTPRTELAASPSATDSPAPPKARPPECPICTRNS